MTNSRSKGGRGEREARDVFRSHGFEAERGCQRSGSPDSPDLKTSINSIHVEVKRTENLRLIPSYNQAMADAGDKEPVVMWRKNRGPWFAILSVDFLLSLFRLIAKSGIDINDGIEWAAREGRVVEKRRNKMYQMQVGEGETPEN